VSSFHFLVLDWAELLDFGQFRSFVRAADDMAVNSLQVKGTLPD
jgi:hypothetical protein